MKKSKHRKKNKNKQAQSINNTPNNENINNTNKSVNKNINIIIEEKKSSKKKSKRSDIDELEEKFQKQLARYNYDLHIVSADGNCLFRSISDQIYGTDKHNLIIREKCMDYIEKNSVFYSQYIEGGEKQMPAYIERKRKDGIWGDNMEIQALSEIYKRPIEIYVNPDKPITSFSNISHDKRRYPIKISYHGNKHYNSIVPSINNFEYDLFKKELIDMKPGKYEDDFIKNFDPNKKFNFMFENSLCNNIDFDALFKDNISKDEEFLLNETIEESKKNLYKNNSKEDLKEKEDEDETNYLQNPIVQNALEFGFDLSEAVEALKICGNNSELVINYLYDKK